VIHDAAQHGLRFDQARRASPDALFEIAMGDFQRGIRPP